MGCLARGTCGHYLLALFGGGGVWFFEGWLDLAFFHSSGRTSGLLFRFCYQADGRGRGCSFCFPAFALSSPLSPWGASLGSAAGFLSLAHSLRGWAFHTAVIALAAAGFVLKEKGRFP